MPGMDALVVAVDFSAASRRAFEAAVQLAQDLGTTLVLVHAFPPLPKVGARGPIGQVRAEIDASEWQQHSKQWAAEARKKVDLETVAVEGKPEEVVAQAVAQHKASLVVVGSHGRSGLKRAVLGSVADAIVRSSKVPVVVVPA
jgi:nucleotide-binding universal stress UspA family protein